MFIRKKTYLAALAKWHCNGSIDARQQIKKVVTDARVRIENLYDSANPRDHIRRKAILDALKEFPLL